MDVQCPLLRHKSESSFRCGAHLAFLKLWSSLCSKTVHAHPALLPRWPPICRRTSGVKGLLQLQELLDFGLSSMSDAESCSVQPLCLYNRGLMHQKRYWAKLQDPCFFKCDLRNGSSRGALQHTIWLHDTANWHPPQRESHRMGCKS